jgi:hypothetical protein
VLQSSERLGISAPRLSEGPTNYDGVNGFTVAAFMEVKEVQAIIFDLIGGAGINSLTFEFENHDCIPNQQHGINPAHFSWYDKLDRYSPVVQVEALQVGAPQRVFQILNLASPRCQLGGNEVFVTIRFVRSN